MPKAISISIQYNHKIKDVWEALTNKEAMSEWLMPCNIEPIVGHRFQFKTKSYPGFDGIVDCEILEVIEQKKLSFRWSGGTLKNTVVSFELTAIGDKTQLNFMHRGFEGFFNRIIVSRILAHGWLNKILPVQLPTYLLK
jgi:uncharacterized protein YndB with AHSA1/START domain